MVAWVPAIIFPETARPRVKFEVHGELTKFHKRLNRKEIDGYVQTTNLVSRRVRIVDNYDNGVTCHYEICL